MTVRTRCLAAIAALSLVGCEASITSPTGDTTTTTTSTTQNFEATISPGGSSFFSFTVGTEGAATIMLASLTANGQSAPLAIPLRVGFGIPVGLGCSVYEELDVQPALTPQITRTLAAGIHCVNLRDAGVISAATTVAIRFTHT